MSPAEPYRIFEFRVEGAPERSERHVDVLLMHGLTGDLLKTWGGLLSKHDKVTDCRPCQLAIELNATS